MGSCGGGGGTNPSSSIGIEKANHRAGFFIVTSSFKTQFWVSLFFLELAELEETLFEESNPIFFCDGSSKTLGCTVCVVN